MKYMRYILDHALNMQWGIEGIYPQNIFSPPKKIMTNVLKIRPNLTISV